MMTTEQMTLLAGAVALVALLYSSVGHAGASGYIAVMALFGLTPVAIKPTALVLNIAVACLGSYRFWRAGYLPWRLWWPFAVTAMPCAFLGGYVNLPTPIFKVLVGVVLLWSAARFFVRPPEDAEPRRPSLAVSLPTGAGLGLLAGLTGTGGGIFLTPLMLFRHWGRTRNVAAVSVLFILVNSVAGLLGNIGSTRQLPAVALPLLVAAMAGGAIGSYLGCRRFPPVLIKRLLAVVLTVAGLKLILA
jgi:uncharacterized membrane protein YfcA